MLFVFHFLWFVYFFALVNFLTILRPDRTSFPIPHSEFRIPQFHLKIKKRERPRPSNFEKARGIPVWHTMQYASLILFI